MSMPQEILDFYTNARDEATRLSEGLGLIELIRIREIMARRLPPPPAVVMDVGGGTGVHSFWLAGQGYQVHLVDVVPRHIEQARQAAPHLHRLASIQVGDARALSYPDRSADAVLLLGPLYHLTERCDRLAALVEARRVLRPGGVLLAAAITRYASTLAGLARGWVWDAEYLDMITREVETGQHRKPLHWNVLTTAFFHLAGELEAELQEASFSHQETLGVQGPGWMVPDFETHVNDAAHRDIILHIARLMEHEPAASPHMVAVAVRPSERE